MEKKICKSCSIDYSKSKENEKHPSFALLSAVERGHFECLKLILEWEFHMKTLTYEALDDALQWGVYWCNLNLECIEVLLEWGAGTNIIVLSSAL